MLGIGIGVGGQQPIMVPQTVLTGSDVSLGTSLMVFAQTMSGTVLNSVANNVFQGELISALADLPVDPAVVVAAGANGLVQAMTKVYPRSTSMRSWRHMLRLCRGVWIISVVLACLSIFRVCPGGVAKCQRDLQDKEQGQELGRAGDDRRTGGCADA